MVSSVQTQQSIGRAGNVELAIEKAIFGAVGSVLSKSKLYLTGKK
jgi:hypothetical protein